MGKRLYKPGKTRGTEPLKAVDRLEIFGLALAAVVLTLWAGVSAYRTLTAGPTREYSVYTQSVAEYMESLDGEVSTAKEGHMAEIESKWAADVNRLGN